MRRARSTLIGCAWFGLALAAGSPLGAGLAEVPAADESDPAADQTLLDQFRQRVSAYLELRKRYEERLPDLPKKAAPDQIRAHEAAMAKAIGAARAEARQGEIFFPAVKPVFVRILAGELRGPGSKPARETAAEGNPDTGSEARPTVAVNATYRDASLGTVPPGLLRKLPPLPEALEYRIVGRDLVLRDVGAGVIVDFIKDATPPLPREGH